MVFDGFSRCRGIFFDVFLVKFCENSISWHKLRQECDSVAQGSDFFCKNEAQDWLKGASEGSLKAWGGHGTDWAYRDTTNSKCCARTAARNGLSLTF